MICDFCISFRVKLKFCESYAGMLNYELNFSNTEIKYQHTFKKKLQYFRTLNLVKNLGCIFGKLKEKYSLSVRYLGITITVIYLKIYNFQLVTIQGLNSAKL